MAGECGMSVPCARCVGMSVRAVGARRRDYVVKDKRMNRHSARIKTRRRHMGRKAARRPGAEFGRRCVKGGERAVCEARGCGCAHGCARVQTD